MNKKRLAEHLEKIDTFKVVADLKSVHKASSRLSLSQPAVSRTIKVLEDVLECRLMERESKGIRLTAEGHRLYEYAKVLEKTLTDFNLTGTDSTQSTRPLRIATYDNIACSILSGLGPTLTSEFPQLSISVGGPNSRILADLSASKFDCALIAQPRAMTGLEYKKVFNERYGIFVSRSLFTKSGLSKNKSLRINDLKNLKIIAMPDAIAGTNKSVDRLLWEVGLTSVISIDSYEVAMQLVRDGLGIGIIPYSTAWRDIQDKRIQELIVKEVPRSTFGCHDLTLCWNAKEKHPGIENFESILTECFSKIRN